MIKFRGNLAADYCVDLIVNVNRDGVEEEDRCY